MLVLTHKSQDHFLKICIMWNSLVVVCDTGVTVDSYGFISDG